MRFLSALVQLNMEPCIPLVTRFSNIPSLRRLSGIHRAIQRIIRISEGRVNETQASSAVTWVPSIAGFGFKWQISTRVPSPRQPVPLLALGFCDTDLGN